jgi:hypothetical protein
MKPMDDIGGSGTGDMGQLAIGLEADKDRGLSL